MYYSNFIDVDECNTEANATRESTTGSFTCTCNEGFEGLAWVIHASFISESGNNIGHYIYDLFWYLIICE